MRSDDVLAYALRLLAEGVLSIDDEGRIWRHAIRNHGQWKLVVPRRAESVGAKGYLRLMLQMPRGRLGAVSAHRLVYTWVYGPIPEGLQINHLDLDKQNNRPSNLEITDQSGNMRHSYANGRPRPWSKARSGQDPWPKGKRHPLGTWRGRPLVSESIKMQIREQRQQGRFLREIAADFGISISHIHRICSASSRKEVRE